MNSPTVSVIVPNYNHAPFLRKRLDSILGQTYQDFEIILLDDCSTDESRAILREYANRPHVRLEFNDVNSGSGYRQWNKGVSLARGKYVWIAESDDFADDNLLQRLVGILESDERITFAYCRSWRVAEDGRVTGFEDTNLKYKAPHDWNVDFCADGLEECRNHFLFINVVPNASAAVFRKFTYQDVDGADENMLLCGDWKLWAAMALAGRMAYTSEPLNYYRSHGSSLRSKTSRRPVSVSESLQVVRWILGRVTLSDAELVKVYQAHAAGWVPEMLSTRVPLSTKSKILRYVRAIDPHPLRRVASPAIETVRKSILRHWREFLSPRRT
jgi:cellulose synthase/poly-beta-1,6-N-acetylglucosamine synthase-like glycosyltransferase